MSTSTDASSMTGSSASTSLPSGEKLEALRAKMKEVGVNAYVVPSGDPHLSEYVPEAYQRRAFISGFEGSAGTALITEGEAFLWTDSRYFNEASLQLDPNHWKLMKIGQPNVPTISKFLSTLASEYYDANKSPFKIGIDPYVHSASFAIDVEETIKEAGKDLGVEALVGELDTLDAEGNLVDEVWSDKRPPMPTSPFRVHPLEYAGVSVKDKIQKIQKSMKEKKATLVVFSALDDVAYLCNMRAKGDIDTCPVGIAYATVSMNGTQLYCDDVKVSSDAVKDHLQEAGITLRPYDAIVDDIIVHCNDESANPKIWIDKSNSNYALSRSISEKVLLNAQNPITPMKASKNSAEMEGMRRAHVVDGVAMAYFMAWLEKTIVEEGRKVSEVEIDEKLTGFRAEQPGFLEVSFPTIAGVGSNGAIIHYRASSDSDLLQYLDQSNPILIDSGGQYEYGTTDVTRTWHFGAPSEEFIDNYTRVLKGNIGVDRMIFPEKTPGFVLDSFARTALWQVGKDYGHGTGHGVGAALNVHEGPHSISPRWANKEALKKGMIVSNEPGYYEDGNFGIRIENLLEILYVKDEYNTDDFDEEADTSTEKKFLKLSKLTLIPIQQNLINVDIMSKEELDWLDEYHETVLEKVGALLPEDSPAMKWLTKSCAKIDRKLT